MSELQLRIPRGLSSRLIAEINRPGKREAVVFGLVSHASTRGRDLILLRDLIVPPDSAFLPSKGHGARWTGAFSIELLNRASEQRLGVFIFHAHGGERTVCLSGDDTQSARELLPRFQMVIPERPHGSVVFARESAAGVVAMPGQDELSSGISVRSLIDGRLRTWPLPEASDAEYLEFQHLALVDAPLMRKILRRSVIAVVGLSGGGSQVVPHLAALEVGEIIGIDPQRADSSNRNASPQLGWLEARFGIHKVTAARCRTWFTNRNTRFTGIKSSVPEATTLSALKRADIIVGCVNNYHARADLNEVAWRYCIPYVDIGLRVSTRESHGSDQLSGVPGQCFTAIPGGPCFWCTDFITEEKLQRETGGRGRSYLKGATGRDALVSPFNGTLAGDAAAEVLRLLSGAGTERGLRHQYDGLDGTLLPMVVKPKVGCTLCRTMLAAGDPVWSKLQSG
jgi:hypothetical protein